jgi:ABC-type cobalamin/Fe3+-siderophores transport system ATPase subunit
MRLVSLTLKNFRAYCTETNIQFGDLTALIGKNDVGKSSVLEALEIFFNGAIVKIDQLDCSVGAADQTVELSCEFDDLPAALVLDAQATTSLADERMLTAEGTLRIKKAYRCGLLRPKEDVFVRAVHPTAQGFDDLLELNNAALKKRLGDLGIDTSGVQQNSNPSIRRAIWSASPDLELSEVDIPVAKEDGKRIWDKLSEHLPMFALFQADRASRDSDPEVQDPMKFAIATALADPAIKERLNGVTEAVRARAMELASRTQAVLEKIDAGLASDLKPEFKSEPKWPGVFSVSLTSNQGIPLNKRGSGVRRLVLVSFFRAEAERRLSERTSANVIYAIEEPETSQHPNNQKMLIESLEDLASEPGCQIVITTHSPGLAASLPVEKLRFIHQAPGSAPVIEPGTDQWEAIAATLGVVPDSRVRALLCVEGPTDVADLQSLSHILHEADNSLIDLCCDPRIAFVPLGGSALGSWVDRNYLKGLGRPEIHIYDRDVPSYANSVVEVNARTDGSWAVLTQKREIENYVHPDAIQAAFGVTVTFTDQDDVPSIVGAEKQWNASTAKKKIAEYAFPKMTSGLIKALDPAGEVEGWLRRIEATL